MASMPCLPLHAGDDLDGPLARRTASAVCDRNKAGFKLPQVGDGLIELPGGVIGSWRKELEGERWPALR